MLDGVFAGTSRVNTVNVSFRNARSLSVAVRIDKRCRSAVMGETQLISVARARPKAAVGCFREIIFFYELDLGWALYLHKCRQSISDQQRTIYG